jgi:hypothetical protein
LHTNIERISAIHGLRRMYLRDFRTQQMRVCGSLSNFARDPTVILAVDLKRSSRSIADLERLADDLTRLDPTEFPDSSLVWMTEPDHRNNRIIVTISDPSEPLLKALAARFGTTDLAVRIEAMPKSGPTDRDHDTPPFYGGASITTPDGGCTAGFAWTASGSGGEMLTAGHCFSGGGYVSYPNYINVGSVASGTEENWSDTYGTRYFPGQTTYRGDVAMIRYPAQNSNYYVYDGAIHTSTSHKVVGMNVGYLMATDRLYVNGAFGGQRKGIVQATGQNVLYNVAGPNVWARNVAEIQPEAPGNCPIPGDSGGPAYTRNADGTLVAMGIHSGRSDFRGGGCVGWLTDIRDAWYGLPGTLKYP